MTDAAKPPSSWSQRFIYLSPWFGVLLIIAIDLIMHNVLLPAEFRPGKGPAPFHELGLEKLKGARDVAPAGLAHYAGAVSWIAAAKLHFVVCVAALTAAWVRLANFFKDKSRAERRRRQRGILIMTLVPCAIFIPFMWMQGNTDMYQLVLQVTARGNLPPGGPDHSYAWALPFIDGLGILTTTCLAGVASQLTYPIVQEGATVAEKTTHLAMKMQMLRFLLYVGMVVLITNIVQVYLFLDQVFGFLVSEPKSGVEAVTALAKALVAARSVLGTLLLAAIYLPASFFLKEEAYKLAKAETANASLPEQDAWLKERDLISSIPEMIPRFAAILAPLMAGPLADLATHIA